MSPTLVAKQNPCTTIKLPVTKLAERGRFELPVGY